ncbi:MAG: hypothetical protein Q7U87_04830, partial [bacterium]|nr:hypothetical protein [bacterium]
MVYDESKNQQDKKSDIGTLGFSQSEQEVENGGNDWGLDKHRCNGMLIKYLHATKHEAYNDGAYHRYDYVQYELHSL